MLTFKELMERINIAKTKMGDVIKDFQDSDAPQFKGKSMEKRRQMAIAAKLEADRGVKEEVEELEELSTDTLKGYRKKARAQGNAIVDKMKMGGGDWSKDQKDTKTLRKRAAGAQMSGKQLVKRGESLKTEEAEQIDELSKKTLGSYVKKAKTQMSRSDTVAGRLAGERMKGGKPSAQERKHNDRANKRYFGIDKAVDRLAKEDFELEEGRMKEISMDMETMGDKEFKAKHRKSKSDMQKSLKSEELKGNQHKIDANKNGKVDSNDFKILRNAKKARYQ